MREQREYHSTCLTIPGSFNTLVSSRYILRSTMHCITGRSLDFFFAQRCTLSSGWTHGQEISEAPRSYGRVPGPTTSGCCSFFDSSYIRQMWLVLESHLVYIGGLAQIQKRATASFTASEVRLPRRMFLHYPPSIDVNNSWSFVTTSHGIVSLFNQLGDHNDFSSTSPLVHLAEFSMFL